MPDDDFVLTSWAESLFNEYLASKEKSYYLACLEKLKEAKNLDKLLLYGDNLLEEIENYIKSQPPDSRVLINTLAQGK